MTPGGNTAGRHPESGGETPEKGLDKAERGQLVQSIVRALNILKALGEADAGMSLTEVAHRVGLTPSTTHRLLTTLQQERFVRFDPGSRLWSIGVQAFVTGNGFVKTRDIVDVARPRMRRLMEESGETVNLAVEEHGEIVYLAQIECRQMMRALAPAGARTLPHCSAVGKALLAARPVETVAKIVERQGMPRLTPATLVNLPDLLADLEKIRDRGYAVDNEEHALGVRCVAAVIYDEHAVPIAAVSVSGPLVRIGDDRVPVLGEMVKRTAAAITRDFGGRPAGRDMADGVGPGASFSRMLV